MNNKILSIIIIVVVIIAVGIALFFLPRDAQQPSPVTGTENSIEYVNKPYGFSVSLPQDWQGYSLVIASWDGDAISQEGQAQTPTVHGPMISIRNPLWTEEKPYQDIPILVFTKVQWDYLQEGVFHIGAAPINPSELGSNDVYVFALPARYNFAYPEGWQQVDQIIQSKPLHTFAPLVTNPGT